MKAAARVAAAETGWGQRQCPQPETPALSYSREQVMPQTGLVQASPSLSGLIIS